MMSELHGNKKKLKIQCQKFHPSKSIMLDLKSDCINAHRGNFLSNWLQFIQFVVSIEYQ